MRHHGADKDQRRHAKADDAVRMVDFIKNEVIATLNGASVQQINPSYNEAGDRK